MCIICFAEYVAATFGRNGISPSYAQFAIPDSVAGDLAYHISVSFLVRTSRQSGLLFYIGTDTTEALSNRTFVAIELSEVGIVSNVKLGDEIQTYIFPGSLADGMQHSIRVYRNYSLLQINLDDTSMDYTINYSLPLMPDVLYVGGMPLQNSRRRRDTYSDSFEQFSGTLQDFQLNGARLQSFPSNETDEDGTPAPSVELPVNSENVDIGEVSDDMCQLMQPCENNATCHTQFYNKYRLLLACCSYHIHCLFLFLLCVLFIL